MRIIIFLIAAIVLYVIAIISPKTANKIKRKIARKTERWKFKSNWFWDPVADASKKSLALAQKSTKKIVKWGKKTRKKLPF